MVRFVLVLLFASLRSLRSLDLWHDIKYTRIPTSDVYVNRKKNGPKVSASRFFCSSSSVARAADCQYFYIWIRARVNCLPIRVQIIIVDVVDSLAWLFSCAFVSFEVPRPTRNSRIYYGKTQTSPVLCSRTRRQHRNGERRTAVAHFPIWLVEHRQGPADVPNDDRNSVAVGWRKTFIRHIVFDSLFSLSLN